MPSSERLTHCPTKGIPMDLILALLCFIAVGAIVNLIGHLVNQ